MKKKLTSTRNMRYAILTNPVTGSLSIGEKYQELGPVVDILGPDCLVYGLDTRNTQEFRACARRLAKRTDVLVVAGGDGTFNEVLNAVPDKTVLAYLPLGSGNALRHALRLPITLPGIARRIKRRTPRRLDLISCNGIKALFASVGVEGKVLLEREKFVRQGIKGLESYVRATVKSVLGGVEGMSGEVEVDGDKFPVSKCFSLIVSKIKFYGYGIMIMPQAKLNDGMLHTLLVSLELFDPNCGLAAVLVGGHKGGAYRACREISFKTRRMIPWQLNGSVQKKAKQFRFKVLPAALRIVF